MRPQNIHKYSNSDCNVMAGSEGARYGCRVPNLDPTGTLQESLCPSVWSHGWLDQQPLPRPLCWIFVTVHSSCLNLETALPWSFLWSGCPRIASSPLCFWQWCQRLRRPIAATVSAAAQTVSIIFTYYCPSPLASQAHWAHSRAVIFLWMSHLQKDNKRGD